MGNIAPSERSGKKSQRGGQVVHLGSNVVSEGV